MTARLAASPVRFHLSLNSADLPRSVEFFSRVFGTEPAKFRGDYAKFEVDDPPLVLSLEPVAPQGPGALNHVGFRLQSAQELVALQQRLEAAGLASRREEGVECCYARQTKFWLHDPDGNLWEFYTLDGDLEHRGAGQSADAVQETNAGATATTALAVRAPAAAHAAAAAPVLCARPDPASSWTHRLGQPLPLPLPFADRSLQRVQLQGTFNVEGTDAGTIETVLEEVARVLEPGGCLTIHCLTVDRTFAGDLHLPGPASVVRHVPVDRELLQSLELQGFGGIRLTTFRGRPCFRFEGFQMRETMIGAHRPAEAPASEPPVLLVYKGPLAEVVLDGGHHFRRGERREVPASVARELEACGLAEQFVPLARTDQDILCTA